MKKDMVLNILGLLMILVMIHQHMHVDSELSGFIGERVVSSWIEKLQNSGKIRQISCIANR